MSRISRIIIDEQEFLNIIKGKIRKELRKYLGRGNIQIRRRGQDKTIVVPVEELEIPTFRYGYPAEYMIGQGEGKPGDDLGPVDKDGEEGEQEGGQGHGDRKVHIELPEEDFSKLFEEILELPRIKPKGDRSIYEEKEKYTTISRIGPHSLRHLRRTFLAALKRNIATGEFLPPEKSKISVWPKDFRFLSYEKIREPKNNAVIFYMRDVSGSMGPNERAIVNRLCDLCEFWLSWNYDKLVSVYIIHDDTAERVENKEEFLSVDFGGGTSCSTAQQLASEIIDTEFPPNNWNIYIVYLSDGMNFGIDNDIFVKILRDKLLPVVNQYNYGQIQAYRPWWGAYEGSGAQVFAPPGTIGGLIQDNFGSEENVAQTVIGSDDDEAIIQAIKVFFGKGN